MAQFALEKVELSALEGHKLKTCQNKISNTGGRAGF